MNLQQLKSLVAILEYQSFSAAANKIGLSHSAISLQIKSLETEFGKEVFDRTTRPPKFTSSGLRAAEMAREVLNAVEAVKQAGAGRLQSGTMSIGVVLTTLRDILPFILEQMRQQYPDMRMTVKSGLSGDLISRVLNEELDLAIVTAPDSPIPELHVHEIADEPLFAISRMPLRASSDHELLQSGPFIGFSRKTLLGRQISARMQSRGIFVKEIMEINSLDAIESMVSEGHGVSIVPHRYLAGGFSEKLGAIAFCKPQEIRRLVMVNRQENDTEKSIQLMLGIIKNLRTIGAQSPADAK